MYQLCQLGNSCKTIKYYIINAGKFKKEVKKDLNETVKNDAEVEVKTFEKKETAKAKKEISIFKKEALTDKEKAVH